MDNEKPLINRFSINEIIQIWPALIVGIGRLYMKNTQFEHR